MIRVTSASLHRIAKKNTQHIFQPLDEVKLQILARTALFFFFFKEDLMTKDPQDRDLADF